MARGRKIEVQLLGDSRSLERAFSRGSKASKGFGSSMTGLGRTIGKLGKVAALAAGAAGVGALIVTLRAGTKEFKEQQKVAAQTEAALKSSGGIAGVTAKHMEALALSLSNLSGVSDEVIQSAENMLLSFQNIRNSGSDKVFDRTTRAVLDFAARTGRDVPQAAVLLGKALEDPATKVSALARAGIVFSTKQKKMIASLVESGKLVKAQNLLLTELEKRFGGAARAMGTTITGKLNVLKERFHDLSGELVSSFAPAFARGLGAVTDFVRRISTTKGFHARLNIVWDGIQHAAQSLFGLFEKALGKLTLRSNLNIAFEKIGEATQAITEALQKAFAAINWEEIWASAKGVADGLQAKLEAVDFDFVGERIGQAIKDAVNVAIPAAKDLAQRINNAIRAIDFDALGRRLGPALATAVVTGFLTLMDPAFWIKNWDLALSVALVAFGGPIGKLAGKLAGPLLKLGAKIPLLIAEGIERFAPRLASAVLGLFVRLPALAARALSPLTGVVSRIFGRLGRLGRFAVKVLGINVAINAVVRLGKRIGSIFKNIGETIKDAFTDAWDWLQKKALKVALRIIEPFTHIPKRLGGGSFQDLKKQWQGTLKKMESDAKATTKQINETTKGLKSRTISIDIKVKTTTVGDRGKGSRGAGRGPTGVAASTVSTVAKDTAKDIADTTKDDANDIDKSSRQAQSAGEKAQTAFDNLLDALDLKLEKASVTKTFRDDIRVLNQMERAILARIKVEGKTTDLLRQLFNLKQQQAEAQKNLRQAGQFKALGLTEEGEKRGPSVGNLKKRLGTLQQQIKGTTLDTAKTRGQLARIAKVLKGQFGKVGKDVREAILGMFNDISGALGEGGGKQGPLTKTTSLNSRKITEGLGLSQSEIRALRGRLSNFNSAGVGLAGAQTGTTGRFSVPVVVESHTNINLDGKRVASVVTKQQQRGARRNPRQKRGPNRRGGDG